ncbi:MAG: outer membrane beta-barrel protein [Verrucomicrobiia bacterium]
MNPLPYPPVPIPSSGRAGPPGRPLRINHLPWRAGAVAPYQVRRSLTSITRLLPVILLGAIVAGLPASAQDALRHSMAGELALASRKAQVANQPYTVKFGDFRLLATPSLGAEYNDNIQISDDESPDDFILRPFLQLAGSYPITQRNLLRLRVGVGYDYYTQHDEYSILRLESGSEISFDMFIKDLLINVHNRMSYIRDPGQEAAVANSVRYGGFDNTAGIATTLDLNDLVLTIGYDHNNFISSSSDYEYLDRASEWLLGRAGFRLSPALITGIEATGSFTSYDERMLNDNVGYSAGVYADWQPGSYFRVQPRAGYAVYDFDQTSRFIRAQDQDSWYAALNVVHDITDWMSYSIAVGHEMRLGIQADSIEDTYVRPSITWRIIRDLRFTTYLNYENGTQGSGRGSFEEKYDWLAGGLNLSRNITRKLVASLHYRHTLRSSDMRSRDYSQNLVGIRLTYLLQ